MNKVFLLGNVGTDPVIRYADKSPVASFTLATNERAYTTASGATVPERTEWHNIVMWNKNAEIAEKYIRKGTRLLIEGKIRTRTWEDRSAIKRTITEIYVESFEFLGGPHVANPAQQQPPYPQQATGYTQQGMQQGQQSQYPQNAQQGQFQQQGYSQQPQQRQYSQNSQQNQYPQGGQPGIQPGQPGEELPF